MTITEAFTSLTRVVKEISNLSTSDKLEAANFVDDMFRDEWAGIEPNRFLKPHTFRTTINVRTYDIPADFESLEGGGLFQTSEGGSDFGYIPYDGGSVLFTVGETVTSGSSGTATVEEVHGTATSGWLIVSNKSGTFADNDSLTGSSAGVAVQNGAIQLYDEIEHEYSVGGRGNPMNAYFINPDGNIELSKPARDSNTILQLKYIPIRTRFTALSDSFVLPERFQEHIRNALLIWYGIFDNDQNFEVVADARFQAALADFRMKISRTGEIWNEQDYSVDF